MDSNMSRSTSSPIRSRAPLGREHGPQSVVHEGVAATQLKPCQNVLSFWIPAAGYAPHTGQQMLADLGKHGRGSSSMAGILLMFDLVGFQVF